jgi:outer membrane protein OmpA-like peptidoglycan-associated protein
MNKIASLNAKLFRAGAIALALAGLPAVVGAGDMDAATASAIGKHFGDTKSPEARAADPTTSADAMVAYFTSDAPADVTVASRRRVDLDIKFEFDSSELDENGIEQLNVAGTALSNPQLSRHRFMLAGHTDDLGDPDYNRDLSLRRAQSARQYLIDEHAIDPERLETAGFGSEQPKLSERTPEARKMNRRVGLEMIE